MPGDCEETNRQQNQYMIWTCGYGMYDAPFGEPESLEEWKRRFNERWDQMKKPENEAGP